MVEHQYLKFVVLVKQKSQGSYKVPKRIVYTIITHNKCTYASLHKQGGVKEIGTPLQHQITGYKVVIKYITLDNSLGSNSFMAEIMRFLK